MERRTVKRKKNIAVILYRCIAICWVLSICQPALAQTKSTKRGVAYGYHSAEDMQALAPGISWWYNWYSKPDPGAAGVYQSAAVAYVPMQWGRNLDGIPFTADQLAANIPAGTQYLLGFNEPNFKSQSNLTPAQAAALWPALQEVARRKNLKLVSPAVNYCGDCVSEGGVTYYSPTQYLDAFFAACKDCQVDYIAVHTYVCEERWLREKIAELKKYNKPIWLTEFSCGDMPHNQITLDIQKKYMTDAVNYLENEPAIFKYAWFSGRNNEIPNINLLGASGQLTELGKLYISLPFNGSGSQAGRLTPVAASASSIENSTTGAEKAVDGNISTRWSSSFSDPQWLQLDFGATKNFARVKINWETAYAKDYQIQTSSDGSTWTSIRTVTGGDGGLDDLTGLSGTGRYLRVYGTQRATVYGYSIYEIEVYEPATATMKAGARGITAKEVAAAAWLYPNPVEQELNIQTIPGARGSRVSIINSQGEEVLSGVVTTSRVNVSALTAGSYTLILTTDTQRTIKRFIKK